MKSVFLFCTKLRMFLSAIPVIILLFFSIKYNNKVENLLGLWPLIIVLSAFLIFIIIFLSRFISISNEEIRMLGVFSSKDSHEINEGKTIKFTFMKKHYIRVELWGIDKMPEFDWVDKNALNNVEITLFRERAVGCAGSVKRVLKHFGVDKNEIDLFFDEQPFEKEHENILVYSSFNDKERSISIKFLTTL